MFVNCLSNLSLEICYYCFKNRFFIGMKERPIIE
ncbi:hypothetical protein Leryth_026816 [Lithospermum erythrorhizon]|nr:hypothetical protein Leryth_026816 [Lithospermum erythrorhizon]